ncbi:MAG: DUF4397 domain-containing protein [Comamonadaceae bacterium]|nr:DUF4397 domain-containing protein [Comamonadaceae bacterium]
MMMTLRSCRQCRRPISRAIHASASTPAVDIYVNGARAPAGVTFARASASSRCPPVRPGGDAAGQLRRRSD